ncbi:hypothetical protein HJ149_06500 [Vibrio parahaemolyticus]|uniref:Pepco domain-containing protein n=1 Tax=Vibrio parahaemolyticus TaxID=670 RepID=UPI00111F9E39|nr:hypothetical protein [Vibrio parahaemolyticus]MBE3938707.1 hypothetical protein [Vibrio parahaemolyticus]TOF05475.1 hypothetical protein CGJ29_19985 [Vibrio parahaemolyticus]
MSEKAICIEILDESNTELNSGPLSTKRKNYFLKQSVLDTESLKDSIKACDAIIEAMEEQVLNRNLAVDSVSFSLGLTAQGKVAFLGTGASLSGTTAISVTFKKQD